MNKVKFNWLITNIDKIPYDKEYISAFGDNNMIDFCKQGMDRIYAYNKYGDEWSDTQTINTYNENGYYMNSFQLSDDEFEIICYMKFNSVDDILYDLTEFMDNFISLVYLTNKAYFEEKKGRKTSFKKELKDK